MKTNGGVKVQFKHSWFWRLMEMSGQVQLSAALPAGKEPMEHTRLEAEWAPEPV
jgi:hypothetical protein